ncbi:MAG TPA: hypothetical protein VMV93_10765, partial [Chloroflexota bacterium]|nr:hypothetical protein [Chloroflexota bacterium]
LDDADVAQGLREAVQASGPIGGLIYLHWPMGGGQMFADDEVASAQGAFFLAKHVGGYLRDQPGRTFFLTVTRLDGALGLGDGHNRHGLDGTGQGQSAVAGGLFGLVKTLRLEWPSVYCRGIDLDPACPADVGARRIMDELLDPNTLLAEVGLSVDWRVTAVPAEVLALSR